MKPFRIIPLVLLLLSVLLMSATWRTDFDKAKEDAMASHKLLILKFSGSDWCIPCIRMEKEIFNSEAFTRFADSNLVMVNADFPRQKKHQPSPDIVKENELLAARYNKDGHFPLTLLLTADGKVLKSWDGYNNTTPAEFISQVKSLKK